MSVRMMVDGDPAHDNYPSNPFALGLDGKHACPYGPCGRRVSMRYFACRAHWMKVPARLRAELYAAVGSGTTGQYLEVRAECVQAMNTR